MKTLALVSLIALGSLTSVMRGQSTRSMQPDQPQSSTVVRFDAAQSVALFVGARNFSDDNSLETVPYAVDDAVDLAFTFALDPRVALVRPERVVLALSDPTPRKPISRRRLAELKRRGATVTSATQTQILKALNQQAGAVKPDGIFIVSFASHGFSNDGAQYLLAANSLFHEWRQTAIPAARIFDLVAKSGAARSLILVDACRERVRRQRSASPEPLSAAPFLERMAHTEGQVVLYAAAAGKWAYDDDLRQNGVFTSAVLDGLQCRAGHDPGGIVTIDTLSTAVERNVLDWIRTNRDPFLRNATQISVDGAARLMPVAKCAHPAPRDPPPVAEPVVVDASPRPSLRLPLEHCRDDGRNLLGLFDQETPSTFIADFLAWRDGCVSVLRELDTRMPQGASETARFLSVANFWCATQCPAGVSPARCALFRENDRAERCFWDLDKAVPHVEEVLIRNAAKLRDSSRGAQP